MFDLKKYNLFKSERVKLELYKRHLLKQKMNLSSNIKPTPAARTGRRRRRPISAPLQQLTQERSIIIINLIILV